MTDTREPATGHDKPRRKPSPRAGCLGHRCWPHLNRIAADLNAILLVLAIGLAVLDLTILSAQQAMSWLAQGTTTAYVREMPMHSGNASDQPTFP